eukprot:TRINITY_DN10352_c0_g1_i2.p1 TRINITY_DN10352_c0_g1~~TRINITY_DN10352_c0_g1_i2.p1  ORF type:complete len:548 (-),score=34.63 TRINITY_DN10352_c0_g1_i2:445-2088(-)
MSGPPYFIAFITYLAFAILFALGVVRDFVLNTFVKRKDQKKGYAPIRQDYEDFYTRRLYYRIHDCWNRPICSAPDNHVDLILRSQPTDQEPLKISGGRKTCINMGSYNYLGFAAQDPYCTPHVQQCLSSFGWSSCSSRADNGTLMVHNELENLLCQYLDKECVMTYGMGFATNSVTLPALLGPGDAIFSDGLNHKSIVSGVRGTGAKVYVFRHNDYDHLEDLICKALIYQKPRKMIIVVEGIYSMEGEIVDLKRVVQIKNKYKAMLYLDEAHSIGALGVTGRGACEHCGVDPSEVDILMGTFTKSFGSCGGYIAANKQVVQYLKNYSPAHMYATSMAPPAAQQILSALKLIMGFDGTNRGVQKIQQLHENANYLRLQLQAKGYDTLGDYGSPVIPLMLYLPAKIAAFSRMCLERNVAMVVVGFPATALLEGRARICVSASHTKQDLDAALAVIDEVGSMCNLTYRKGTDLHTTALQMQTKIQNGATYAHLPQLLGQVKSGAGKQQNSKRDGSVVQNSGKNRVLSTSSIMKMMTRVDSFRSLWGSSQN